MAESTPNNMAILDYFNWKAFKTPPYHCRLHDVKTNIPLPLLSYTINKLLPSYALGYQDTSLQKIRNRFTVVDRYTWSGILTGSIAEGMQMFNYDSTHGVDITLSDADFMIVPKSPPPLDIYDSMFIPERIIPTSLSKELLQPYPGYVIITPKNTFAPFTKSLKEVPDVDSFIKSVFPHQCDLHTDAGPSQKVNLEYTDHYNNTVLCEVDFVYALPCLEWPLQASKWSHRQRPGKWPSTTQMESVVKSGVHYVKKSPPQAGDGESLYYWRISFSVAERTLCKMFNDTQRQCAVLLKLLKQKQILPKDVITSYHLKTIMFWACEQIPLSKWKSERVGHCFLHVLDQLHIAVIQGSLRHYFIPELNLFEHKISKQTQMSVIKAIADVRNNLFKLLSTMSESYNTFYLHHKQQLLGLTHVTESFFKAQLQEDLLKTSSDLIKIFTIMLVIAKNKYQKYQKPSLFQEAISCMEEMASTIGTAIKYKQYCSDVVKSTVLAVFDEITITPYYEYILKCHTCIPENQSVSNKTLFYQLLLHKYTADSSVIAAAKNMVPTFEKIFT